MKLTPTQINARYRARNPKRYMLTQVKSRAKREGLEFNLTEADLEAPEHCPVLGMKLNYLAGHDGTRRDNSASIDRLDSTRGYVRGNVKIVSWRANRLKSNCSAMELRALATYMETFHA